MLAKTSSAAELARALKREKFVRVGDGEQRRERCAWRSGMAGTLLIHAKIQCCRRCTYFIDVKARIYCLIYLIYFPRE